MTFCNIFVTFSYNPVLLLCFEWRFSALPYGAQRNSAKSIPCALARFQQFQHFQQVFHKMLHNGFRHFDGLLTIQQVFNKTFNISFCYFFSMCRRKSSPFNFSTDSTTTTTTSYINSTRARARARFARVRVRAREGLRGTHPLYVLLLSVI